MVAVEVFVWDDCKSDLPLRVELFAERNAFKLLDQQGVANLQKKFNSDYHYLTAHRIEFVCGIEDALNGFKTLVQDKFIKRGIVTLPTDNHIGKGLWYNIQLDSLELLQKKFERIEAQARKQNPNIHFQLLKCSNEIESDKEEFNKPTELKLYYSDNDYYLDGELEEDDDEDDDRNHIDHILVCLNARSFQQKQNCGKVFGSIKFVPVNKIPVDQKFVITRMNLSN